MLTFVADDEQTGAEVRQSALDLISELVGE
jgi:hypothetical protein